MLKCVKTHDSRVSDLVGSTNREKRGVSEADAIYIDSSAVSVRNFLYLFTHMWFMLCYVCAETYLAS